VFVANPNKPKPILDILLRNQEKLVDFLSRFHTDRSEDEQFNDEKAYLIKQIKELKPSPSSSAAAASSSSSSSTYSAGSTYFGSNPGSKTTSIVVPSSGTSHALGESSTNIGPSCTSINTQSGITISPNEMSSVSPTITNSINSSCSFSTAVNSSGAKDLQLTNSSRNSNVPSSAAGAGAVNSNISVSSSANSNAYSAPYRGVDDRSDLFD
jgi:hypothetical protein